jgi:von Willebrand factor type A domain
MFAAWELNTLLLIMEQRNGSMNLTQLRPCYKKRFLADDIPRSEKMTVTLNSLFDIGAIEKIVSREHKVPVTHIKITAEGRSMAAANSSMVPSGTSVSTGLPGALNAANMASLFNSIRIGDMLGCTNLSSFGSSTSFTGPTTSSHVRQSSNRSTMRLDHSFMMAPAETVTTQRSMRGYIVVDVSASMQGDKIISAINGVRSICSNTDIFREGDVCTIAMFNTKSKILLDSVDALKIDWSSLSSKLERAVRDTRADGTDMYTAIDTIMNHAESKVTQQQMVHLFIITDGKHNRRGTQSESEHERIDTAAQRVHYTEFVFNFTLMAIGMENSITSLYKRKFCSSKKHCNLVHGSNADIAQHFRAVTTIMKEQRQNYSLSLTFESTSTSDADHTQDSSTLGKRAGYSSRRW